MGPNRSHHHIFLHLNAELLEGFLAFGFRLNSAKKFFRLVQHMCDFGGFGLSLGEGVFEGFGLEDVTCLGGVFDVGEEKGMGFGVVFGCVFVFLGEVAVVIVNGPRGYLLAFHIKLLAKNKTMKKS